MRRVHEVEVFIDEEHRYWISKLVDALTDARLCVPLAHRAIVGCRDHEVIISAHQHLIDFIGVTD